MNARSAGVSGAIVPICYGLTIAAWVLDMLTPQLFVVAILFNGPIALSGIALRPRLTLWLVAFAQVANIVAGYYNGASNGYVWDATAVGDRVLIALSFVLVGYLTVRAQEYARISVRAAERDRAARDDAALRRAADAIRATLNVELVREAIVRQTPGPLGADRAVLVVRKTMRPPERYACARGSDEVAIDRLTLDAATASLAARAVESGRTVEAVAGDAVARTLLEANGADALIGTAIASADGDAVLFALRSGSAFDEREKRLLRAVADIAETALAQAGLFATLGEQNDQIAGQRAELQERNEVIRDIVYALAHDLRTPLAAGHLTLEQAQAGAYGELPERYREVVATALASNDEMRRLVETLLVVARYEAGEASSVRVRVDLRELGLDVTRELDAMARSREVALTCDAPKAAAVMGDPGELRRALVNLVANALEATPAGGRVTVRVEAAGGTARASVTDDGFGVDESVRPQLFSRFASASRRPGAGTGLGLSIVRRIARAHGGDATYGPNAPRGSIFTIVLPEADA
ncbi:MAG TPA: HAMP domain-containing sensor histidine kinase [Candidatus Baltobacteraceae bacterium]|jgi:signal transduction histidine kinase